jgi:hypothetical protein
MLEWGISSIFTVTVDNASANDTAIEYLKRKIRDKVGAIMDNEFMHLRCCAHIHNLIVTDGLKEVSDYSEGSKCGEICEVFTFKI